MTLEFNWVDCAVFGVLNLLFVYVLYANEIRQLHKVYIFFHFAMMLWPFGQFSLSMTKEPLYHWIYLNLSFIGIAMLCFGWLLFSILLTRGNSKIKPLGGVLLALPAIAAGAIVLTNPIHGKFVAPVNGLLADRTFGPFFWFFAACCMLYIISGVLIMLLALHRSEAYTYRRQVIFFIAGLALLLGFTALDTAVNTNESFLWLEGARGLTSVGIVASAFCFVIAMRKHNVFQVVSLALREVVDSMDTGIVILDQHHVVLDHNAAGRRYCSVSIGQSFPIMSLMEGAIEPQFGRKFLHSYYHEKGKFLQTEIMVWDEKRLPVHVTMRITPVYNENGIYIGRIATFQDVTEWRHLVRELHDRNDVLVHRNHELTVIQQELCEANRKLELLATVDPLTGCYNRRYLFQMLEHQLAVEHRYRVPFSIILFDVDHFKHINDTFGHQVGDEVLKHTASIIRGRLRETDIFARYGGEEFIIHLPHTTKTDALILAEELRTIVESQVYRTDSGQVNITISIGVISSDRRGHNGESPKEWLEDLLKEVDQALYEAKHTGRNRIVIA